ncbi:ste ste11 protein kinase [Ceraceosorus bombacis]|uniref:Ste ste11 protein kinase n=1 Tax=Ceraceosorus bombacis TaxID=401625 RepID=A0A0P1BNQ1_9BASI|nr:ste ste11 protein kinase [Ceraceosorus bombacis]
MAPSSAKETSKLSEMAEGGQSVVTMQSRSSPPAASTSGDGDSLRRTTALALQTLGMHSPRRRDLALQSVDSSASAEASNVKAGVASPTKPNSAGLVASPTLSSALDGRPPASPIGPRAAPSSPPSRLTGTLGLSPHFADFAHGTSSTASSSTAVSPSSVTADVHGDIQQPGADEAPASQDSGKGAHSARPASPAVAPSPSSAPPNLEGFPNSAQSMPLFAFTTSPPPESGIIAYSEHSTNASSFSGVGTSPQARPLESVAQSGSAPVTVPNAVRKSSTSTSSPASPAARELPSTSSSLQVTAVGPGPSHGTPPFLSPSSRSPSTGSLSAGGGSNHGSAVGFFSSLRPSSPMRRANTDDGSSVVSATSASLADTGAGPSSVTTGGISAFRDRRREAKEREKASTKSTDEARARRPSSVFEHVGGMWERFGKRVHSRGESRDSSSQGHRRGVSAASLTSGGAMPSGSALDTNEEAEEQSPNGSYLAYTSDRFNSNLVQTQYAAGGSSSNIQIADVGEAHATGADPMEVLDSPPLDANELDASQGADGHARAESSTAPLRPLIRPASTPLERVLIQVTEDNERFSVVDISGLSSAAAIKERMLSKLHIFDSEHSSFALYRTEIGQSDATGPRINDDALLAQCLQLGDSKGTLKFLMQQIIPARDGDMLPPPVSGSISPQKTLRDLPGSKASYNVSGSTSQSGAAPIVTGHSKSSSLSSKSTVSDVLAYSDALVDGTSESQSLRSASTSGSMMQRGRAKPRRPATAGEYGKSPPNSASLRGFALGSVAEQQGTPISSIAHYRRPSVPRDDTVVEELDDEDESTRTSRPSAGQVHTRHPSSGQSQPWVAPWEEVLPPSREGGPNEGTHALRNRPPSPSLVLSPQLGSSSSDVGRGPRRSDQQTMGRMGSQTSLQDGGPLPRSLLTSGGRDLRHHDSAAQMYAGASPPSEHGANFDHRQRSDTASDRRPSYSDGASSPMHAAKSMDDLRLRNAAPPAPPPGTMPPARHPDLLAFGGVHPLDTLDGRYPSPSVARATPTPPSAGSGSSAPARHHSGDVRGTPFVHAYAGPQDQYRARAPSLVESTYPDHQKARAPSFGSAYSSDGRMLARPVSDPRLLAMRPMPSPGFNTPPRPSPHQYQAGPGPLAPQYDGRYLHQARPPNQQYTNEFGARMTQYAMAGPASDPRLQPPATMSGRISPAPFSSRPHTYHDMQAQHSAYFRPPQQGPSPHIAHQSPGFVPREDPFAAAHFPASSSRQVSEFQRTAYGPGGLQPGKTVQETLRSQHHPQPQFQPHGHSFGPREPRDPRVAWNGPRQPYEQEYPAQPYRTAPRAESPARPMHTSAQMPQQSQHYGRTGTYVEHQSGPPSRSIETQQRFPQTTQPPNNGPGSPMSYISGIQQSSPSVASLSFAGPSAPASSFQPNQEQHRPSETSSGSSYASFASGGRNVSVEDQTARNSVGESIGSAPTSARSSRSEPLSPNTQKRLLDTKAGTPISTNQALAGHGSPNVPYDAARRPSVEDQDLLNIRPLPKPPQSQQQRSDASRTDRMLSPVHVSSTDDEGTFDASRWASVLSAIDGDGTARPGDGATLRPDRSDSSTTTNASSFTSESTSTTLKAEDELDDAEDGGGTFASFVDDDDDDDAAGTWARPLDPKASALSQIRSQSGTNAPEITLSVSHHGTGTTLHDPGVSQEAGSRSPRRPQLTISIDSNKGGQSGAHPSSPRTRQLSIANAASTLLQPTEPSSAASSKPMTPTLSGVNRRLSFAQRETDWAPRPPPEQLYENLDEFFPKHDLDKPVLEALIPGSPLVGSPKSDANVALAPPSSPTAVTGRGIGRSGHKKSIRLVAQDRKRLLERGETTTRRRLEGLSNLERRRSTKLWGGKVIEMTPGTDLNQPVSATSVASPTADANSRPVFKWVKGDLIGKGTYGRVYLALNATTGEMIAVKQVELPNTDSDRLDVRQKGMVDALKSEIETLKDLDHPHIVAYLGFEETRQFLSIFLEYVPGGSVGSCLRKHGKLEENTTKSFVHQVLTGLEYLHSKGILHRDLKADNLLVDQDGVVKISDFGTVRKGADDVYGDVASMSLQGSIFWMAPEVLTSTRGYSAKVDIWSLGCVVLEMMAGRRPWSDQEAVEAMFKIGAERRAPPIPADVRLSKAAAHFLRNCFQTEPANRPTAAKLLTHVFPHVEGGWSFSQTQLYRHLKR